MIRKTTDTYQLSQIQSSFQAYTCHQPANPVSATSCPPLMLETTSNPNATTSGTFSMQITRLWRKKSSLFFRVTSLISLIMARFWRV